MRKVLFLLGILLIFQSCFLYFDEHTTQSMRVNNRSSDTLWVIMQGDSIENYSEILPPMDVDFHAGYLSFYSKTFMDTIIPQICENDFISYVDSFSVFRKISEDWVEVKLPNFWSFENWWIGDYSDDGYLGYHYYYNITDSLLQL